MMNEYTEAARKKKHDIRMNLDLIADMAAHGPANELTVGRIKELCGVILKDMEMMELYKLETDLMDRRSHVHKE